MGARTTRAEPREATGPPETGATRDGSPPNAERGYWPMPVDALANRGIETFRPRLSRHRYST
jgi:hypothetical protein